MSATVALGSLSADLSFSVSYSIASELLSSANEAGLSEEELIGIVLALAVVLGALPSSLVALRNEIRWLRDPDGARQAEEKAAKRRQEGEEPPALTGLLEFFRLLFSMAQRIAVSICVQLVASNVRSREPLRIVRIVSLLGVSIFFLFLESTSAVGRDARN